MSPEKMFGLGNKQLASYYGYSPGIGIEIQPIPINSNITKLLLVYGTLMFYADVISDIFAILEFDESGHPEWVILVFGSIILLIPTCLQVLAICQSFSEKELATELILTIFHLHPLRSLKNSWSNNMEDPDFCNLKLLEAIVEDVPQSLLQMFATFVLAQSQGWNEGIVISIVISILAMSQTLGMVFDRPIIPKKEENKDQDSTIKKNIWKLITILLCLGSGGSDDFLDLRPNFISLVLFLFHFSQIFVRFVSITWFLGMFRGVGFGVVSFCFLIRLIVMFFYYPKRQNLSILRKILISLYGLFIDGLWQPSEKEGEKNQSYWTYVGLGVLSSIENIIFVIIILIFGRSEYQLEDNTNIFSCFFLSFLSLIRWLIDLNIRIPLLFPDLSSNEIELRSTIELEEKGDGEDKNQETV